MQGLTADRLIWRFSYFNNNSNNNIIKHNNTNNNYVVSLNSVTNWGVCLMS